MQVEGESPSVKLPSFEGPLDLLLHLIRINEIDIYDIPIVEITRQFDSHLQLMRELDLGVAGEYLVMAATLVQIKSRMLLPAAPDAEEAGEDPRADLVRQLIEHEKLRAAAENLRDLAEARDDVYLRAGDPLGPFEGESWITVSLFDLVSALKSTLDRLEAGRTVAVTREEFSIEDKIEWILETLERLGARQFGELLAAFPSRGEKIVTFLALLELIRQRRIMAAQRAPGAEIYLMGRSEPADGPMAPAALATGDDSEEGRDA